MAYYLYPCSPQTYAAFLASPRDSVDVRPRFRAAAAEVRPGEVLVCYLTGISRWAGLLEVEGVPRIGGAPFSRRGNDSRIRLKVKPMICLPVEQALPIHDQEIWRTLSFTRGLDKRDGRWQAKVGNDLTRLAEADGAYLVGKLCAQAAEGRIYPVSGAGGRGKKTSASGLPRAVGTASDQLSRIHEADGRPPEGEETRESRYMQALIAKIGAAMGMRIWIPKADRPGVLREWPDGGDSLLDSLPLSYDAATLRTIEQIDVLWLRGHSIVRAFEVEHTTSIYSGILRMADLLALQPNMEIKLHIVAPDARRRKVFQELTRPVFSLLERRPLAGMCTYLSYESLRKLAGEKHLAHLVDSVLDEYAEEAEDAG